MTSESRTSSLELDGTAISFRAGQTVAGALVDHGIVSWRVTRHAGRPRGVFCGIGICFDCLVVIDGVPNQRACLIPAAAGMAVSTQEGTGHADRS